MHDDNKTDWAAIAARHYAGREIIGNAPFAMVSFCTPHIPVRLFLTQMELAMSRGECCCIGRCRGIENHKGYRLRTPVAPVATSNRLSYSPAAIERERD